MILPRIIAVSPLFPHEPYRLHERALVFHPVKDGTLGARGSEAEHPGISAGLFQLKNLTPEHSPQGCHDQGVEGCLEIGHGLREGGRRQERQKNMLVLDLTDPLSIARFEPYPNRHPNVVRASGLGSFIGIHNL